MSLSKTKVGMVTFVLSEATFFLMLVIAYVYYQGHPASRGEAARLLDPWTTGFFSLCLFASSYTVHRAGVALHRRRASRLRFWLAATIGLGAIFLVGQAHEYLGLFHAGQNLGRDLFGSSFFTLTGFHGFHVLVGLVILTSFLGLSLAGKVGPAGRADEADKGGLPAMGGATEPAERGRSRDAFEAVTIYWHFVDGVWVVIFAVVYLWAVL